ncbi:cell surface protein, partial [Nocardia beijingensis]
WERKDLALRGPAAQTAGDTGYVTAAIGDGLNLVTFDTRTGATIDSDVLPGAKGTTTGTSVGAKGEVVVATRIGEIFAFEPE